MEEVSPRSEELAAKPAFEIFVAYPDAFGPAEYRVKINCQERWGFPDEEHQHLKTLDEALEVIELWAKTPVRM